MSNRITDADLVLTGPGTIAGRYMRRFWQPVYRSEDLPAGQAKPVKILNEEFTLYRGQSGKPHAVGFRCSHRGTQMNTGFIEGDCIRCFYHGWMFDASGACVERPGVEEPPRPAHAIRGYPTEEYLGLIFVWFGEGEAPPLPRFPAMEGEGLRDVTYDLMPVNFFFSLENDAFHFAFAHRDLLPAKGLSGVPKVWAEETDWGIAMYDQWPNQNKFSVAQKGMPNVGYIVPAAIMLAKAMKHALHVSWRVPVDDNNHATFRVNLLTVSAEEAEKIRAARPASYYDRVTACRQGDAILRGELTFAEIKDRTHVEFIQDYVAQVGQGGIETRNEERLASIDACTVLWRRVWKRELQALADGGALKDWRLTDKISTPSPMF